MKKTCLFMIIFPSKHLLVLKTWWRRRLKRNNFRRLEDISQDVFKTSSRQKIVTLKTSSRRLQEMSSRCPENMSSRYLQDVLETKKWKYLYLKNPYEYVSNKSIFHKFIPDESKANLKLSIRTQWFQYSSYFKQHFYFEN